ncbi:MAG: DUF3883 domain-containing protein [Candidatus Kerfeldbacteria bacterium]|nr:DUF3883 domain-containing protein [Candidatus Kerfeldbacteria bacterium]
MAKDVELKALQIVMEYEKSQGRDPRNDSPKRCGYDIKSGDRLIEVKGQGHPRGDFIQLYKKLLVKLGKRISQYYIYVVYDIKNKPKLKIIPPDIILANLEIDTTFLLRAKAYTDIPMIEIN